MPTTFTDLLNGVAQYYGSGSDQWATIAKYGVNAQTLPIIQQVPGVSVTLSKNGEYLGYDYKYPFKSAVNPASAINSNLQSGSYNDGAFTSQVPSTALTNPSTGVTTMESGAKVVSTGQTLYAVADKISLALAGVAIGTKLGKAIDSALYNASPEWWDEHYPTINPETWDTIATSELGKDLIRGIFGLQDDSATLYLDERLLAYTYLTLLENGAFSNGEEISVIDTTLPYYSPTYYANPFPLRKSLFIEIERETNLSVTCSGDAYIVNTHYHNDNLNRDFDDIIIVGSEPFTWTNNRGNLGSCQAYTEHGITYYATSSSINLSTYQNASSYPSSYVYDHFISFNKWAIAYIIFNNPHSAGELSGVETNPEASIQITPGTLINPTTEQPVTPEDDIDDVLTALKTAYPSLFDNAITEDTPQSDGSIKTYTYIPTPYPDTTNDAQPVTDTTPGIDPQTNPEINPQNRPDNIIDRLIGDITEPPETPDTGEGDTPTAIIPAGSANALYSIYNPSQSELNNFGAWLWSSNFVDQLLKLFNDPMQAIIGLHKIFAQPEISGASTIKVGYLDSGVSSNVVGNQYATIDCGSVNVSEYFGNVFDYDPFTQIYIYLPFVGIEKLDTGDVMRGSIGVKYHVDVLTGACLAEITITRDGSGGILYTFTGNCAVQYPVSSGSYMGIVASLASIAGGVVGTVASGGMLAPLAMGAVSGVMNAHTRVSHSGAFSGNAGAMGVKKPYIIITRPQTCLADNFPAFDGYPANKTTTIAECSGFVKCKTCHVENVPATDAELTEIEMLLKGGIII